MEAVLNQFHPNEVDTLKYIVLYFSMKIKLVQALFACWKLIFSICVLIVFRNNR